MLSFENTKQTRDRHYPLVAEKKINKAKIIQIVCYDIKRDRSMR